MNDSQARKILRKLLQQHLARASTSPIRIPFQSEEGSLRLPLQEWYDHYQIQNDDDARDTNVTNVGNRDIGNAIICLTGAPPVDEVAQAIPQDPSIVPPYQANHLAQNPRPVPSQNPSTLPQTTTITSLDPRENTTSTLEVDAEHRTYEGGDVTTAPIFSFVALLRAPPTPVVLRHRRNATTYHPYPSTFR